ncbi:hypothetical protein Dda_9385 [Drechslerella dactyloides]|uniref:F-box domain-containing protein n=1 Tax=Drechslerella dactyloides TaxID=74499 RepID=A0AAD6NEI8_DREDA|nr:hypothetical protein Dda_9385 [Drechslerella dactyloides]
MSRRSKMHVTSLPPELQIDILGHLELADQMRASAAYPLWSELIGSQPLLRTHYSHKHLRGVHRLISESPHVVKCILAGKRLNWYLYNGENILQSRLLDEPLFAPWVTDSDIAQCQAKPVLPPLGRDFQLCATSYESRLEPFNVTEFIAQSPTTVTVRQFLEQLFLRLTLHVPDKSLGKHSLLLFSFAGSFMLSTYLAEYDLRGLVSYQKNYHRFRYRSDALNSF